MKTKLVFALLLTICVSGSAQLVLKNSYYTMNIPAGFIETGKSLEGLAHIFENEAIYMTIRTDVVTTGGETALQFGRVVLAGLMQKGETILPGSDSVVALEIDNTLFYKAVIKIKMSNGVTGINEIYTFDDYKGNVANFTFIYTERETKACQESITAAMGSFKMKHVTDSISCMQFSRPACWQFLYGSLLKTNLPPSFSLTANQAKQTISLKCVYAADLEKQAKEEVKSYKKAGWKSVDASNQEWKGIHYKQIGLAGKYDDGYYSFVLLFPKDKYLFRVECIGLHDTFSASWALKYVVNILDSAVFK